MSVNERAKTAGQIRIHQESFIEDLRNFKKNNKVCEGSFIIEHFCAYFISHFVVL